MVGINRHERRVVLGEAKWLNEPMTPKQLDTLIERGRLWLAGESGWDVHYALFCRSGFTQPLLDLAAREADIHLFTPESMLTSAG